MKKQKIYHQQHPDKYFEYPAMPKTAFMQSQKLKNQIYPGYSRNTKNNKDQTKPYMTWLKIIHFYT